VRRSLPSLDQIARALLVHGARDAAVDLMEAVVARGGEEKPRCEALLHAVRARPSDRVSGPPIALDAGLVEALAAQGRLIEAWAVTRGARVGNGVAGMEIAQALSLVMDPGGLPEPWLTRWTRIVVSGSLADISAIEREVIAGQPVPPVLLERMRIAWRLLKGFWSAAASEHGPAGGLDPALRTKIHAMIGQRDLPGALALLRAAAESSDTALPIAMALARLLSAAERAMAEESPTGSSTVPLEGAGLALLQLRMGNFQDAERLLRKLVVETPADHVARDRLSDVLVLRRAIEGVAESEPEPLELAKTPAPDWLNKRGPRANIEGWASAHKPMARAPSGGWDDEDEGATSVQRPDEEAELHVLAGHPERAVPIYELLAKRYPDKPRFQTRLAEVRALVAQARQPAPVPVPAAMPKDGGEFVLEGPTSVEPWRAPPARASSSVAVVETVVVPVRPIVRIR
jgi:tetratricopeptide (TPR) repeat protein